MIRQRVTLVAASATALLAIVVLSPIVGIIFGGYCSGEGFLSIVVIVDVAAVFVVVVVIGHDLA